MATLALVLLAGMTGCARDTTSTREAAPTPPGHQLTATPGIVRAGICPPAATRLRLHPGRVEAFQGELLRRLGFKLALRMQISTLATCERPAEQLAGQRVDLVVTAPGQEQAGQPGTLHTEPYLVVQYALVVTAGSRVDKDGLAGLVAGTRVGVLAGSQGAAWARDRLGRRGVRTLPFADQRAAVAALARGGCDALILPRAGAVRATSASTGLRVRRLIDAGERATFLVAAANPALGSRIDRMLEEIVFDGSYAVIFHRHLAPTPVPVDFLPPD